MSTAISPFLTVGSGEVARPFAAALPQHLVAAVTSPWSPQPAPAAPAPAAPAISEAELVALRAAATTEGREAGRLETEVLRDKLRALIAALEASSATRAQHAAEQVAGAAVTVIEAWLGHAPADAERFAPAVRGWIAATGDGGNATATANPADTAALREAIGDAKMTVVEDVRVAAGDVKIAGATLELVHAWSERLAELRTAIATALVHAAQQEKTS